MQILIIEDEALLADALKRAAIFRNHHVIIASTGTQALEKLKNNKFDSILSDLILPDMTGLDVYKQVSEHIQKKFVFHTGTTFGPIRQELDDLNVPVINKGATSMDSIFSFLMQSSTK